MLERSEGEEFDFESRIVSSGEVPGDGEEVSLRPKRLDEYVGQNKVKENLKVYMEAAKSQSFGARHSFYRRDPSPSPDGRGDFISRHGGF